MIVRCVVLFKAMTTMLSTSTALCKTCQSDVQFEDSVKTRFVLLPPRTSAKQPKDGWRGWNFYQTPSYKHQRMIARLDLVDTVCSSMGMPLQRILFISFTGATGMDTDVLRTVQRLLAKEILSREKKETLEKEAYLTHIGYKVVSIWECEWDSTVKDNKNLKLFLKAFFDATFGCQKAYTQEQLIASIQSREIFGFALSVTSRFLPICATSFQKCLRYSKTFRCPVQTSLLI